MPWKFARRRSHSIPPSHFHLSRPCRETTWDGSSEVTLAICTCAELDMCDQSHEFHSRRHAVQHRTELAQDRLCKAQEVGQEGPGITGQKLSLLTSRSSGYNRLIWISQLGLLVLCTECLLSEQVGDALDKDLGDGYSGCIPASPEESSSVCQHMQPLSTKLALSRMYLCLATTRPSRMQVVCSWGGSQP